MTGRGKAAIALAGLALAVGGVAAGRMVGSQPAQRGVPGPLPLCPKTENCDRVRVRLAHPPEAVRQAAREALGTLAGWTGRAEAVTETASGAEATFRVGPFRDDLAVAVEAEGAGSMLWVRSASRIGRSDVGVNRMRVAALVEAIRARLG